jgi:hypothetical protein
MKIFLNEPEPSPSYTLYYKVNPTCPSRINRAPLSYSARFGALPTGGESGDSLADQATPT